MGGPMRVKICKILHVPADAGDDTRWRTHVDSLGLVRVVLELERMFGVEITDEIFHSEEFATLGGVVENIRRLK